MIAIPGSTIGLSALSSMMRQLSVTSNNLANVNTPGFSRSRVDLTDIPSGLGVNVAAVTTELGGGGVESTGISTQMAISGNGFFAVRNPQGGRSYTRAGQFQFDRNGFLVDPHGNRVQGFAVDSTSGASRGVPSDIRLPSAGGGVQRTSNVNVKLNLDSNAPVSGFRVVQGENDVFQITAGYPSPVSKTLSATIPAGTYTGNELASQMESALESTAQTAALGSDFTVNFDGPTGKFSVVLNSTTVGNYAFQLRDGTRELNVDGAPFSVPAGSYTPTSLASTIESQVEAAVPGTDWTVGFDSASGKYSMKRETAGASTVDFTGAASGLGAVLGFTSNRTFTGGAAANTETSDVAPYTSVDFQTSQVTVEAGQNSGVVVTDPGTGLSTRVDMASGNYSPDQLASALQTAVRSGSVVVPAAGAVEVTYDTSKREYVITNPAGSGGSVNIEWDSNVSAILHTDEGTPALFGFSRASGDLSLAEGQSRTSTQGGGIAPGRATNFAALIGFKSDTAGGPSSEPNLAASTLGDDVDPGQSRTSDAAGGSFDVRDSAGTSTFATSVAVTDSLGNPRIVEMYFRRTGSETVTDDVLGGAATVSRWEWAAVTSEAGTPTVQGSGALRFSNDGRLYDAQTSDRAFDFPGAVQGQTIDLSFGSSLKSGGSGLDGATQFASASTVTSLEGDGIGYGSVLGTFVDSSGTLRARLSSGQDIAVARVAIATFTGPAGLSAMGEGLFGETAMSGSPLLGDPGSGAAGMIHSGALETSNVDLSTEIVQMLRSQRGYQANLRSLAVDDELTRDILNLRR